MSERAGEVTRLLQELRSGNRDAASPLFDQVYSELHAIAAGYVRRERPGGILQPTALVNEAYLRLFGESSPDLQSREHFFRVAARVMRRILIDQSREENADKRGGARQKITLEDWMNVTDSTRHEQMDLNAAIDRLSQLDDRQAGIIEMLLFAGRPKEEIAEILGLSTRTIEREIVSATAWLRRELAEGGYDA